MREYIEVVQSRRARRTGWIRVTHDTKINGFGILYRRDCTGKICKGEYGLVTGGSPRRRAVPSAGIIGGCAVREDDVRWKRRKVYAIGTVRKMKLRGASRTSGLVVGDKIWSKSD